jgi:hypothetical protein
LHSELLPNRIGDGYLTLGFHSYEGHK